MLKNMKEIEKKENICEICGGTLTVHVTVGWKDYSFYCPKCRHNDFLNGIKNVYLSEETALMLINNYGQAGE